jgi:hypothetical protein
MARPPLTSVLPAKRAASCLLTSSETLDLAPPFHPTSVGGEGSRTKRFANSRTIGGKHFCTDRAIPKREWTRIGSIQSEGGVRRLDGSLPQTSQFVLPDLLVLQAAKYEPTALRPATKHSRSFVACHAVALRRRVHSRLFSLCYPRQCKLRQSKGEPADKLNYSHHR